MEVVNFQRRFLIVAFDVHAITPRTRHGNTNVMVIIDVFTRRDCAIANSEEEAETLAQTLLEQ